MRKFVWLSLLMTVMFCAGFAQEATTEEKKDDPLKNLCVIKEPVPVPEDWKAGFDTITVEEAAAFLTFISSDVLQGRDTATPGYRTAAEFAAALMSSWGLKPAGDVIRPSRSRGFFSGPPQQPVAETKREYLQTIPLKEIIESDARISVSWKDDLQTQCRTFEPNQDFQFSSARTTETWSAPVVFVGYGLQEKDLEFDEYAGLDVKGKIVLMLSDLPGAGDPDSPFQQEKIKNKYMPQQRRMRRGGSPKTRIPGELGARAVLMVEADPDKNPDVADQIVARRGVDDEQPIIPGHSRSIMSVDAGDSRPGRINTIRISRAMAGEILNMAGKKLDELQATINTEQKPASLELPGVSLQYATKVKTELTSCANVLGYLEGSDPELKNEVVVIGAHLDHLGQRGDYIFNGADDNGSGSVGVLEIAHAFATNPVRPKRSILFALWTGEEKGLLGSRYYTNHPYFPLEKTVTCINLDMISTPYTKESLARISRMMGAQVPKEAMEQLDIKRFLSASLSISDPISEALKWSNQYVGMSMYLRPSENASGGSDHAPFGQQKVPWTFLMSSMTDKYHQPNDSIEKSDIELLQNIARMAYLTAGRLANQ